MKKLGFWEAYAIGIGGMIGGGIFAVLGLTILLAGGGAPVAFALGGAVALLTSYSYAKLSVRYPSRGGTVEFLVRAFGNNLLTGYLNTLLLASYIIMLALYAYAFGSYASALISGGESAHIRNALTVGVITLFTLLNFLGAYVSGKTEEIMVFIKVGILLTVAAAGLFTGDFSRLSPDHWKSVISIAVGGLIIFLAYEGFELIANTSGDVRDPERVLPRAFYSAVITVTFIYVLVSAVAVANLNYEDIQKYSDYALAVAVEPFLGQIGFTLVGTSALLSTASAINATLYGSAWVSYLVAKTGSLPKGVTRRIWKHGTEGLVILAVLSCAFALIFNVKSISTAGSLSFLTIFACVNLANFKLSHYTDSNRAISLTGFIMCGASIAVLIYHHLNTDPSALLSSAVVLVSTLLFELFYRALTKVRVKEYIDWRLREGEQIIKNYEALLPAIKSVVRERFTDAEIYLTGKLAAKGTESSGHLNVTVLTEEPWESDEEEERYLKKKLKLKEYHPVHLRLIRKSEREKLPRERKRL